MCHRGVFREGENRGRVRPASGRGAGMHRVRGASGDVLARGPGFPPDLSPVRPPRPRFPPSRNTSCGLVGWGRARRALRGRGRHSLWSVGAKARWLKDPPPPRTPPPPAMTPDLSRPPTFQCGSGFGTVKQGARGQSFGGRPGPRASTSFEAPRTPCIPVPLPPRPAALAPRVFTPELLAGACKQNPTRPTANGSSGRCARAPRGGRGREAGGADGRTRPARARPARPAAPRPRAPPRCPGPQA